MADKYINPTGLQTIKTWIEGKFALGTDLSALQATVDGIVAKGGEPNTIDTISVNSVNVPPDINKNVNITVPTKTSDLTNDGNGISNFATESYVSLNGGKIDKIKVNGTDQTITNKTVDISVPTKTSELTNDSNFPVDANYVHTDNNFTNTLKSKLEGIPAIDTAPSNNSSNLVTSGGVYTAIQNAIVDSTNVFWCEYNTTTYAEITAAVSADQLVAMNYSNRIYYLTANALQTYFFVCPIVALGAENTYFASCDNNNLWNSGSLHVVSEDDLSIALGDYLPLAGGTMTGNLFLNGAPTTNLQAATKKYVDDGLGTKQNTLTFDATPTSGSSNPVTSGGVYSAIPRNVSDLTNDSGYQTASQVETAINTKMTYVYRYKGSVATYSDLPASGNTVGDVYDVQSNGVNYAWTGTEWDALGSYVDTSLYWAKSELVAMTTSEINAILNA